MNINNISNERQNFGAWQKYAQDHMALYLTGKVRPLGFEKLVNSIERNSSRYIVECECDGKDLLMLKAQPLLKHKDKLRVLTVHGQNLKSCLKSMNRMLKRENNKFEGTSELKEVIKYLREVGSEIKSSLFGYSKKIQKFVSEKAPKKIAKTDALPEVTASVPPIKPIIIPKPSEPAILPEGKLMPGEPPITIFEKFPVLSK